MKIKNIYIEYFRGLQNVDIQQLDDHVNLFVGINGAGKSSILDAMSLIFSWYIARMLSAKGRGRDIPVDDISFHSPNGCTIELGLDDGSSWKLYRSLKYRKADKSDLSAMNRVVGLLREGLDLLSNASIPLIVYYGVNRIVSNAYTRLPHKSNPIPQLDAYKNALTGGQLFSDFFNWFRFSEDYENERYKENKHFQDHGLEAVRRAMSNIMPDYSDLKITRRPLAMTMKKGNETFKINQLSDGEKCYISLVCDIARRLAVANPTEDPLKGEGIVLIDEIDLHLHPKWQQTIISKLVKTFPNCQFFITTHSSIVASDVKG
ncbi:MAG: AAA family ATPase [Bacteroides sp.]|nr:AAA family ATPase [Bacteroides sp.]